ncbi:MAG: 2-amino-4-hydroxy-6-hydroxymethyldihydropteridine diphosphokinase [Muribaculaceae bacterium]
MNHTATLCIGSNCDNRRSNISAAIQRISTISTISWQSPYRESEDVTGRGASYLNRAVTCLTSLTADEFAQRLAAFEKEGGRVAESKAQGKMPVDIDIVVWDNDVVSPADYNAEYFRKLFEG